VASHRKAACSQEDFVGECEGRGGDVVLRSLQAFGLTVVCLIVGYGFYRMNQRDWLNSVFFTLGILGIMMSFLRNSSKK
jgi:hypothetical protein